jgi:hypothetical protein
MTNSEYQDLIAFLGRKFEEVDRRFDQTATKEELGGAAGRGAPAHGRPR